MNLKKIIFALLFISFFLLFVKPSTANAANFYGCTGRISNTYNSYTCYFTNYTDPSCSTTNQPGTCKDNYTTEKPSCYPDPEHGTLNASTLPCGACAHNGTYWTCQSGAYSCGSICNIAVTTLVASDPECTGISRVGVSWDGTGCNVTCSGWYYCDANHLAYDTTYTGTGLSGACTNNGIRDPAGDSLCGGGGSNPPPSNLSATQVCTGTPNYTFNWTKGTSTDTTNLYYCDQTYAQAHGVTCTSGVDVSADGSRAGWYLLWNQSTSTPPQSIPLTTSAWPWGASGTTPLTIGDLYRWQVTESNGTTAQGTDFTAAACSVPVNGVCAATHYSCTVGTSANNVDGASQWTWNCNGANGGTNASCAETKAAPTCTMTANPTYVQTGGTSTLTATYTLASGVTGTPGYTWNPDTTGATVTGSSINTGTQKITGTWNAPLPPFSTQTIAHPGIQVCNPNGGACGTCALPLKTPPPPPPSPTPTPGPGTCTLNVDCPVVIVPTFSAAGQVYVDAGKNGQLDPATDFAYTNSALTITICSGNQPGGCATPYETLTTNSSNGLFTTANTKPLISGSYTAILTLPSGYQAISPKPPVAVFTVGNSSTGYTCAPSANCDANGNIINLNFGISNSLPWMQSVGGDILSNGFTDNIPATADLTCSGGAYASAVGAGGTPGIVNTGSSNANFGQGAASAKNWLVGGLGAGSYPYVYNLPISNQAQTSFTNLSYLVKQSNIDTKSLSSIQGCSDVSNCTLPTTTADFPSGVYTVGNLTLNGTSGSYTFPAGGKYTILVNGILTINTKVFVPNGSFVLFSTSDDINVTSSVGDTSHVTTSNLEGYYSTDKSFNAEGKDASGNGANCATNNEDLRLNVAGSIVVNADTSNNGGFYYQRDMCANDLKCPVFTITERPDLMLNAPTYLQFPRRVWQEVAP